MSGDHQSFGQISSGSTYTLARLSQIFSVGKAQAASPKATREALKKIGCPIGKFGRTPVVSGSHLISALERSAEDGLMMDDEE